jgi:ABC-type branched-subunit amino acid transport system ATPase component
MTSPHVGLSQRQLEVTGLRVEDGALTRLDNVCLTLERGSVTAMIGPAGAGRLALLEVIAGFRLSAGGAIRLDDRDITRLPPAARVRRGIARTYRNPRLLPGATVLEVTALAQRLATGSTFGLLRSPVLGLGKAARERLWDLLERTRLADLADHPVDGLPLGYRRLVDLARALAGAPRLLLLEHPWRSLARLERLEQARLLHELRLGGLTLLMVEDDSSMIAELAEQVLVLDSGRIVASGPPETVGGMAAARRAMAGLAAS